MPSYNELKKAPASVKLLDPAMQAEEDARAAAATSSVGEQYNNEMLVGFGLESSSSKDLKANATVEQTSFTKIITAPEPAQKQSSRQPTLDLNQTNVQ